MTNLFKIGLGDWNAFQGDLAQAGYTVEDVEFLRGNKKVLKEMLAVARRAQVPLADQVVPKPTEIATWRTIEIGRHKNAKVMRNVLEASDRVSQWADQILAKIEFAEELQALELVVASVGELCGNKSAMTTEVFAAGLARGWELCPAEIGPALREQYADQPKDEWLRIAMEPIIGSDGYLLIFSVEHVGVGLRLGAYYGLPGYGWVPEARFVFVRSKR